MTVKSAASNKRKINIHGRTARLASIASSMITGSYNGGSISAPAFKNWRPSHGDANQDTLGDLDQLRVRSRDLVRNAPVASSAINTVVSNVIGTGLSFHSMPDAKTLNISDDQAADLKQIIEREWKLFCENQDIDASRQNDFYGLQSLALRSMLESGDVFALTPVINRGNPYSLSIQLVESDRVCNSKNARDTSSKMAGIQVDQYGSPLSYDIANKNPGMFGSHGIEWRTVPARGKNGRIGVIHLFDKKRPGQVRGVPYLAPVIESIKQLSRYSNAELQAAVVSAALAIFVKMDAEAFESLFDQDSQGQYIDSASGWDGSLDMDGPGKAVNLLPGENVEVPSMGRPNANFDPFFFAMLKQIGPALEIPFEVLTKSFNSSYSASRAALLDFWRFVRVRRDFMATNFCEPIKKLWFIEAVAKGRIAAPGFFASPVMRQAYMDCKWIGDSAGSIDPDKEVKAAAARVQLGISTREKESVAYDGGSWESNYKQLVKENELMMKGGLKEDPVEPTPLNDNNIDSEDNT